MRHSQDKRSKELIRAELPSWLGMILSKLRQHTSTGPPGRFVSIQGTCFLALSDVIVASMSYTVPGSFGRGYEFE